MLETQEEFEREWQRRQEIEDTHAWRHQCFPPGPTICMICRANQMDINLQPCLFATLEDAE